jgi:DNA-binding transcriptional LysR family regulator
MWISKMNSSFDWTLVRSFLAALEHGSLLGAARALKSSQPTIGRHIAELESQLGVALFERTGRGLKPLAMALKLADSARAMEAGAHQLQRHVSSLSEEISGTVRITASQTMACVVLPPLISRLKQKLPGIQIELVSSNAVSNLLRREADIAVRMVRPDQTSLVAKRIGKVTIGVYAHRDYLQRAGIPREPVELLEHALIGGDKNDDILRGFAAMGQPVTHENFSFRSDDLMANWYAVRSGVGIGFVSDFLARTDTEVVALVPMLKIPPLPVWLAVHREIRTNKRIRAVYDFLGDTIPAVL